MRFASPRRFVVTLLVLLLAVPPLSTFGQAGEEDAAGSSEASGNMPSTEINVKNADIGAIIKIFSKKTKRNFILDERVKGKVSIFLPGKVNEEDSLRILDSVLAFKGFTSVPIGDNLWKIVPSKEAKQSTIPTRVESPDDRPSAATVTRLVNLKFVSAEDAKQLVGQLISGDGLVSAVSGTNSLLIIDSEDNIERLIRIIDVIDVPSSDRDMTIIPIKHANAEDIAKKIAEILGQGQGNSSGKEADNSDIGRARARLASMIPPPGVPPGGVVPATGTTTGLGMSSGPATSSVTARSREPKIIADERTNSIILVADEDTTARIRALISQLDSTMDLSGNRFYVYRCQHANAQDLAEVLAGLVGGSTSGGSSNGVGSGTRNVGSGFLDNGFGGSSNSSMSSSRSRSSQSRSRSSSGGLSGSSFSRNSQARNGVSDSNVGPTSVQLGDNLSITADPATNSLIINGNKSDYEKILELLDKLDVRRRQVLVEAMLLEVGVSDSEQMGFSFLSSTGGADGGALAKSDLGGDLATLFSDPTKLSGFSVAAASAGSLTLPGDITIPTQAVLLQAAKNNSNVNVLSAPQILATDNEEASIIVGQNVPFIASTATNSTNLNNTFNSIDREDVGITLKLTPQISGGDSVTLRVFTEVSNVTNISPTLGPTTTVRSSETKVISKDGQMVVIGGLMADAISDGVDEVPFLSDVPVLGHFFRDSTKDRRRTNLLIFITPRIIKDQFDARDVTIDSRDRLEDIIAREEHEPNRAEVLHDRSIDQVAAAERFKGEKPTTIFSPPKASSSKQDAQATDDGKSPISLKASPRLPDIVGKDTRLKSSTSSDATISLPPSAQFPAETNSSAEPGTFIVLDLGTSKSLEPSLPFYKPGQHRYVGIEIPSDSANQMRAFFKSGQTYRFDGSAGELPVVVAGVFASSGAAHASFKDVPGESSAWYRLSPYELLNLGKGPWLTNGQ